MGAGDVLQREKIMYQHTKVFSQTDLRFGIAIIEKCLSTTWGTRHLINMLVRNAK